MLCRLDCFVAKSTLLAMTGYANGQPKLELLERTLLNTQIINRLFPRITWLITTAIWITE